MNRYEVTWKRHSDADMPENRQEEVERIAEELDIEIEYKNPSRELTADYTLYFEVCSMVVERIPELILLYEYLTRDDDNEVEMDEETREALEQVLEEREVNK